MKYGNIEVVSLTGSPDQIVTFDNNGKLQASNFTIADISGANVDLSPYTLLTTTASISSDLQTQINSIVIPDVSNFITDSEVASISAGLESRITTIENDYLVSSDLTPYTLLTTTEAVSSSLQSQITGNDNDISNLETNVTGLSAAIDSINVISGTNITVTETPTNTFTVNLNDTQTGNKTFSNNVTINGNLYVNGTETIVNTQSVSAEDNQIVINAGETGNGVTAGVAGIRVDRGTLPDYDFQFRESDDTFVIGIDGDYQAVATREDSPTSNGFARWNASESRFDTTLDVAAASHTHSTSDISNLSSYTGFDARYYTETEVNTLLSGKSDTSHNHTLDSLSNTNITSNTDGEILRWNGTAWINNTLAEAGIAAASHNHTLDSLSNTNITSNTDGEILRWNGTAWINNTLAEAGIAAASHTHSTSDITNLSSYTGFDTRYYTETEVNTLLSSKSDTSHNHTLDSLSNTTITSNTNGEILRWNGTAWINNTLAEAGIAAASHNHTLDSLSNTNITSNTDGEILRWNGTAWINNTLAEAGIAATSHTHSTSDISNLSSYTGFDARYYTETEVDTLLSGKSDTSHTHSVATTGANGFMSSTDKSKLDGIASGAEVNQNAFSNVAVSGQTTIAADGKTDTLTVAAGSNVTLTTNATTDTLTVAVTAFPYGSLTGVPSTFTPSAHTLDSHSNVTITSNTNGEILRWNGTAWVNNTLAEAGIAATSHTHSTSDISNLSSYTGLDARYYTETEVNTLLSSKSDTSHNHTLDSLSNVTITNNTNGEILRWNGTAWVNNTLEEAGIAGATVITADTTVYVATTGNDSNDGSVSSPWATLQHAMNVVSTYTIYKTATVTIQVQDGTYNISGTLNLGCPHGDRVVIRGNTTTPANVVLSITPATNGNCILIQSRLSEMNGFTITQPASAGTSYLITVNRNGFVRFGANMVYNPDYASYALYLAVATVYINGGTFNLSANGSNNKFIYIYGGFFSIFGVTFNSLSGSYYWDFMAWESTISFSSVTANEMMVYFNNSFFAINSSTFSSLYSRRSSFFNSRIRGTLAITQTAGGGAGGDLAIVYLSGCVIDDFAANITTNGTNWIGLKIDNSRVNISGSTITCPGGKGIVARNGSVVNVVDSAITFTGTTKYSPARTTGNTPTYGNQMGLIVEKVGGENT